MLVPQSLARLHHRKDLTYRTVTDTPESRVALAWPEDRTTDLVEDFIGIVRGRTVNSTRGRAPAPAADQQKSKSGAKSTPRKGDAGGGARRKPAAGKAGGRTAGKNPAAVAARRAAPRAARSAASRAATADPAPHRPARSRASAAASGRTRTVQRSAHNGRPDDSGPRSSRAPTGRPVDCRRLTHTPRHGR